MHFALSDEQTMLRDSVLRFVADDHDFETARRAATEPDGFSRAHWASFAELGWLALMVPEADGGIGGSLADAALLMEGFGRGLVAAPFLSTAILGVELIAASQAPQRDDLLERLMSGGLLVALATEEPGSRYDLAHVSAEARRDGEVYRLSGTKIVVPDGASADLFLVSVRLAEGVALMLVPAGTPDLGIRRYRTIDARHAADLDLSGVALGAEAVLLPPPRAAGVIARAIDHASLMLAAEAIGAMEAATALTADYLKTRQQFRRPLSSFQVLTHRVADMFVKIENARSMLLRGLAFADSSGRAAATSATMVTVLQAAEFVCGQAIQLHGGIGMTEEAPIGHYYKRIRAIGRTWGDLHFHLGRYGAVQQEAAE